VPGTEIRLQRYLEPACSSDDEWCAPFRDRRNVSRILVVTHRPPLFQHTEGEAEGFANARRTVQKFGTPIRGPAAEKLRAMVHPFKIGARCL
jgi:hypothetical protein